MRTISPSQRWIQAYRCDMYAGRWRLRFADRPWAQDQHRSIVQLVMKFLNRHLIHWITPNPTDARCYGGSRWRHCMGTYFQIELSIAKKSGANTLFPCPLRWSPSKNKGLFPSNAEHISVAQRIGKVSHIIIFLYFLFNTSKDTMTGLRRSSK